MSTCRKAWKCEGAAAYSARYLLRGRGRVRVRGRGRVRVRGRGRGRGRVRVRYSARYSSEAQPAIISFSLRPGAPRK